MSERHSAHAFPPGLEATFAVGSGSYGSKAEPTPLVATGRQRSDALDLEPGVFTSDSPRRIALSLKRSAERSTRRKAGPFQSAMSMLNLYINRAGRTLPARKRQVLERAKRELRVVFGRAD